MKNFRIHDKIYFVEKYVDETVPQMMKTFHELDSRAVAIVREFLYNDNDVRECVRRLVTLWASQNAWGLKNVTQETRAAVVDRLTKDNFEAKLRQAVPQHKVLVSFLIYLKRIGR